MYKVQLSKHNHLSKYFVKISVCLTFFLYMVTVSVALDISDALLLRVENKYGEQAALRLQQWQQLMQSAKKLPEPEKLKAVNDFFNQRIDFVDDMQVWGMVDYWATPLELLIKGKGDCEDYSVAKYFTLKELGVPEQKMRITYVKAVELNQAHMVLTYFVEPQVVPVVLDNLIAAIKPATARSDLLPVYSFNGIGLWLAKARGRGKHVGDSTGLDLWSELKQRMLESVY